VDAVYLEADGEPFVCIHCGRCVSFCPHDCLEMVKVAGSEDSQPEEGEAAS
jgi:formate hydrogenlyase subunit 6/NADH:ubiquinone oxidoreductase subunit I